MIMVSRGWIHRPGRAEQGLLVAHLDVAPGQEKEQFAVTPEVAEIQTKP